MTLTDTGPLVALCDTHDPRHRAAVAHASRLAPLGLHVCEPVLVEACFHLPQRFQRARLRAILEELRIDSVPTGDPGTQRDVFDWLAKYEEHEPDWADGCLAVLCGRNPRLRVWTYAREFRTIWRLPNGGAIPLAVRN